MLKSRRGNADALRPAVAAILKPVKLKLCHDVARRIARHIIDEGLREGQLIGREPELLKRYGISRDTLREALRVLEWQGLARTARGPSGGLVVAKPSLDAIVNILRDFLDLTDISFHEVTEARHRLQRLTVRLATIRLASEMVPRLRALLAESLSPAASMTDEIMAQLRLIHEIGHISGNAVLALFIAPLDYVAVDFANFEKLPAASLERGKARGWEILKAMVEAIIANDDGEAVRLVDAYLTLLDDVLEDEGHVNLEKPTIYPQWFDSGRNKSAQGLIYQIKRDIDEGELVVGDRLGSEADLMRKYGVSRSIFREASRILELLGVTQSRKGRDGGLIVARADPGNTIEAAAQFLEQAALPFEQIYEARIALDTFATELAARRRSDGQLAELEAALDAESRAETTGELFAALADLHDAICRASGNRVVSLYIKILIHAKLFQPSQLERLQSLLERKTLLVRSHERIIRDIRARDAKSASRHMRDHRAQMASLLQL